MNRGTTNFLKVAIFIIGIIVLSLCVFLLPPMARYSAEMNPEYAYLRYPVLIGLYITAIPGYLALYQGLKLLHYIENNNIFSELAVNALKHIKYDTLAIVILYIIGMLFLAVQNALHPGIAIIGFVIIFAFLCIALFSAVLQELLRSAVQIKSENDLTV